MVEPAERIRRLLPGMGGQPRRIVARGDLMWMFRPVHGGIWKEYAADATLRPDGTREPPCPVDPLPPRPDRARRTVYRFGLPDTDPLH